MMNQQLVENNYIYIPNFLSSTEAKYLASEFKKFCEQNKRSGDSQVPYSQVAYNYSGFLELLCEKTPEVNKLLGEKVLPTYSYARVYKNGATLDHHTDREACEVSLTMHLDGDSEWPIYIKKPNGEEVKLNLKSGDAMMYLGTVADHWREQFEGSEYVQVFLHYVQSKGDNAWAYFDKEKVKPIDFVSEKKEELPVKKIEAPVIITGIPTLDDYVVELENMIDPAFCKEILDEYVPDFDWKPAYISGGVVERTIRNVDTLPISQKPIIAKNPEVRQSIDDRLYQIANKAINEYNSRFPDAVIERDSGYELLRYNEGQFYKKHTDHFAQAPRTVSCSFALNDDYEGGAWSFWGGKMIVRPNIGSLLMFPSTFLYPHEIIPVTKGTRYSIITWFV
jgi:hypothetical protein